MAKEIPISCAKSIADQYGYDQVVVYARKVGENGSEQLTTYGTTKEHCSIAAKMADVLKKFMGWSA